MLYLIDNLSNSQFVNLTPAATILVILLAFDLIFDNFSGVGCISQSEVETHLELGRQFLAKHQLSDALTQYHAAVEGDPHNYLTYFKRGTVYLALGKAHQALSDFDQSIALEPRFTAARLNRGQIYLKLCRLEHAQLDFRHVLESDPYNYDVIGYLDQIAQVQGNKMAVDEILEICKWSVKYRKLRSDLLLEGGDYLGAVTDLRYALRLEATTDGYFDLTKLLYSLGMTSDALKEVRECLKLDPEHAQCFPLYKKLKLVEKWLREGEDDLGRGEWEECVAKGEKVIKMEGEVEMVRFYGFKLLCGCYLKGEESTKAVQSCRQALEVSQDAGVYCDRAEAYLLAEMYDDAIRDYQSASELNPSYERAREGLQRAQKLQMAAERRDYYKILDVKRSASKKEIVKAYRKAAQKWHPDNFGTKSDEEKKIAEKKFIDIAAAKEVLTDPEKRAQFDNGEDPLDPEQNRGGGGGHPFHHFHQGSPFQFKFHFN